MIKIMAFIKFYDINKGISQQFSINLILMKKPFPKLAILAIRNSSQSLNGASISATINKLSVTGSTNELCGAENYVKEEFNDIGIFYERQQQKITMPSPPCYNYNEIYRNRLQQLSQLVSKQIKKPKLTFSQMEEIKCALLELKEGNVKIEKRVLRKLSFIIQNQQQQLRQNSYLNQEIDQLLTVIVSMETQKKANLL